jgi:hypothetical protein
MINWIFEVENVVFPADDMKADTWFRWGGEKGEELVWEGHRNPSTRQHSLAQLPGSVWQDRHTRVTPSISSVMSREAWRSKLRTKWLKQEEQNSTPVRVACLFSCDHDRPRQLVLYADNVPSALAIPAIWLHLNRRGIRRDGDGDSRLYDWSSGSGLRTHLHRRRIQK